jgi:hypothetical protein
VLVLGGAGGSSTPSTSRVDDQTNTLTELAAITTTSLTPPVIRVIYNSDTNEAQTWVLLAGTDATESGVVQRPDDYAASTNEKVWYRS